MRVHWTFLIAAVLAAGSCSSPDQRSSPAAADGGPPSAPGAAAAPAASRPRIVILGDSLTAGLGLSLDEAYPALLQRKLEAAGYGYEVVNAGVSGDTTAGGLRRLDWSLDGDVRILIIALGANDGLRGVSIGSMKENITAMIDRAKRRNIQVILAGMEALPNLGREYTDEFRTAFRDLAKQHEVGYIPFLLDGVAGVAAMNQSDRLHPNREGARRVADHVWRALEPVVRQDAARR